MDEQNALFHLQGQYFIEAILSSIGNRMRGKGEPVHKYPKEPFKLNTQSNNMSEYDKQRAVDKFFAEQDAMRMKFRRNKQS